MFCRGYVPVRISPRMEADLYWPLIGAEEHGWQMTTVRANPRQKKSIVLGHGFAQTASRRADFF
jgi:hypothetical protein